MMDETERKAAQRALDTFKSRLGEMVRLQRCPPGLPGTQLRARHDAAMDAHAKAMLAQLQAEQELQALIHKSYAAELAARMEA